MDDFILLFQNNSVCIKKTYVFIDYHGANISKELRAVIRKYRYGNHLSNNVSESVTNYVYWYNNEQIKFKIKGKRKKKIIFRDKMNEKAKIIFSEYLIF